jgi:hypothetical protein
MFEVICVDQLTWFIVEAVQLRSTHSVSPFGPFLPSETDSIYVTMTVDCRSGRHIDQESHPSN